MGDENFTAFPIWTEVVKTTEAEGGGGRGNEPLAPIGEILGWKVNPSDADGIRRALAEAFPITRGEDGRSIVIHKPRGFRLQTAQAGAGAVTGAQRSLYERARTITEQIYPLLDTLKPLTPSPDWENIEAVRSQIRPELEEILEQFGAEGGPVVSRVDALLRLLIGFDPNADMQSIEPDDVGGQLRDLRVSLGMTVENVNTLEEEQDLTEFETVVNYVGMIQLMWFSNRDSFIGASEAFLGTQSVRLERALTAVCETVDEVYRALDSVFIGPADRNTIRLNFTADVGTSGDTRQFVGTIAEFFEWIDDIASTRGFDIVQTGGKYGVYDVLNPLLVTLSALVRQAATSEGLKGVAEDRDTAPQVLKHPRVLAPLQLLYAQIDTARDLTARVIPPEFTPPTTAGGRRRAANPAMFTIKRTTAEPAATAAPPPPPYNQDTPPKQKKS